MMKLLLISIERGNGKGSALVGALVGAVIGISSLAFLGNSVMGATRVGKITQLTLQADAYAIELLEFFLSFSAGGLKNYLSYPLCEEINNPKPIPFPTYLDPLADLPKTPLINVNRFYRVEVVNLADPNNLTSRRDLCGQSPSSATLASDERYLVRVGVTWQESGGANKEVGVSGIVSP